MPTLSPGSSLAVLVVDDHHLLRRGLIGVLSEMPGLHICGEASSGEEALRLARELEPDLVMMDLRMPGIGGLEAARRIRIALPRVRIVGVTAWEDEPLQRLFRHGFAACVGKSVSREELASVIERVMGGDGTRVAEPQRVPLNSNPFDRLTGREMQVCLLLLAGALPADIALRLFISVKTVHTFRYRILEKLQLSTDIELARLATQYGLIGGGAAEATRPIIGA